MFLYSSREDLLCFSVLTTWDHLSLTSWLVFLLVCLLCAIQVAWAPIPNPVKSGLVVIISQGRPLTFPMKDKLRQAILLTVLLLSPTPALWYKFLNFFLVYLPTPFREFQLSTRVSGPFTLLDPKTLPSTPWSPCKIQSSKPRGIYRYQHPQHSATSPLAYLPGFKSSCFWPLRHFLTCLSAQLWV